MRLITTLFLLIILYNIGHSQCMITEISTTIDECDNNDQFNVTLSFDYINVSDSFEVLGNGQNYGLFSYSELPVTIEELSGDCSTNYEFIVRDQSDSSCSNFTGLGTVCCGQDCNLSIFSFEHSVCQEGTSATVAFNLEIEGNNTTQFTVYGAENYSMNFNYDQLPLNIENFPTGSSQITTMIVCDDTNIGCCDTLTFENPCTCSIYDTQAEIVDCDANAGSYFVSIDFNHQMTSDSFLLGQNTVFLGHHAYDQLPVVVGPFDFDENEGLNFLVVDQIKSQCFNEVVVGIVDDCNFECDITHLFAELSNCNDGNYSVAFEFDANNATSGDFYQVFINEELVDTVSYGEIYYTIHNVELDCEGEFTISIIGPEGCLRTFTIEEIPCCPCPWRDFVASSFCDGDQAYVTFQYFQNVAFGTYHLDLEGEIYGPYNLGQVDTIQLLEIENGTYHLVMFDEISGCETSAPFQVDCISSECDIYDVVYEWYEECDGNLAKMDLQIEGQNLADSFAVSINGQIYGSYSYEPTFVTIEEIEVDCDQNYELRIQDLGTSNCVEEIILEDIPCCETECDVRDLVISSECTEDSISITLTFIHQNVSEAFSLGVGGNHIGIFQYEDLPIQFTISVEDFGEFRIADQGSENCVFEFIPALECDCDIYNVNLEYADCTDTSFAVVIDFDIMGLNPNSSFIVRGNGVVYGEWNFMDLPIKIENLDPLSEIEYEFIIIATENDNCVEAYILGIADCTVNTLDIKFIDWNVISYLDMIKVIHNQKNAIVNLYNINGQLTMSTMSDIESDIDISSLPRGIYIVNIVLKTGQTMSKKIFKL